MTRARAALPPGGPPGPEACPRTGRLRFDGAASDPPAISDPPTRAGRPRETAAFTGRQRPSACPGPGPSAGASARRPGSRRRRTSASAGLVVSTLPGFLTVSTLPRAPATCPAGPCGSSVGLAVRLGQAPGGVVLLPGLASDGVVHVAAHQPEVPGGPPGVRRTGSRIAGRDRANRRRHTEHEQRVAGTGQCSFKDRQLFGGGGMCRYRGHRVVAPPPGTPRPAWQSGPGSRADIV